MTEKTNAAKNAREIVLGVLRSEGWKIRNGTNGEHIYTTPEGRASTICLHQYGSGSFWRWHIDHHSVRIRGKLEMVTPIPPTGMYAGNELTILESELLTTAQWIARWMVAVNYEKDLPESPVALHKGNVWRGGYDWSIQAQIEHDKRRNSA